jgi:hypothetical protein
VSGGLSVQATIVATILALGFLVVVFELVRRHYLQERYSVIWAVTGVVMLVGVLTGGSLSVLTKVTGIRDTSIALLSLVIFFLLVMVLHLTTVVSRLAAQSTRLAQEVSMLELRQSALEEALARQAADRPV